MIDHADPIPAAPAAAAAPVRQTVSLAAIRHGRLLEAQREAQRYQSSLSDRHNSHLWTDAITRDAASAMRPYLQTARNRARLAYQRNAYIRGWCDTLVNDVVGQGPTLQLQSDDDKLNAALEADWHEFAENDIDLTGEQNFTGLLGMDVMGLLLSGSILSLLGSDPQAATAVRLRLQAIEADRLSTPLDLAGDPKVRDGIRYDATGRPLVYYVLKAHPGDTEASLTGASLADYDTLPADRVLHLYRRYRPGQTTDMPWIEAMMESQEQLREYGDSVQRAARRAAGVSGVLYTDSTEIDPDDTAQDVATMEEVPVPEDSYLVLPKHWQAKEHAASQPASTYREFKHERLNEGSRSICMPFNIAAGNSGGYNYASGRLDDQIYVRFILSVQELLRLRKMERCLTAFVSEWMKSDRCRPSWRRKLAGGRPAHTWNWRNHRDHVDPETEAKAQSYRLASHTTTLADEWGRRGEDWRPKLRQRAEELAYAARLERELGVALLGQKALAAATQSQPAHLAAPADDAAGDDGANP